MKTLARAVTYSLFAVIIAMALSVTWTTGLFWIVLGCVAAVGLVIVTYMVYTPITPSDDDDTRLVEQVNRYHCAGHGCYLQVTSKDSRGTRWTCAVCGDESWVPCANVYDQAEESA